MGTVDPAVYPEIKEKREHGWSLRKLGSEFGVSGERIRQILVSIGYSDDGHQERQRAARRAEAVEKARDRMMEGESLTDLRGEVRKEAEDSLTDDQWLFAELTYRMRSTRRTQSPEELKAAQDQAVAFMKSASKELGTTKLTMGGYRKIRTSTPGMFSEQWISRLFGSWNAALAAAGLEVIPRTDRKYARISDEEMRAAVRRFVLDWALPSRSVMTLNNYRLWATENGEPAAETVLLRFGSWTRALEASTEDILAAARPV